MKTSELEFRHVMVFLVLTFVLSWLCMGYIIHLGGIQNSKFLVLMVMWIPGSVSILYRLFGDLGFKDIGRKVGPKKYWVLAFTVPLIVASLSYAISWIFEINTFTIPSSELLMKNGVASPFGLVIKIYPILFVVGCIAALGEELGWRGFLIPKLCHTHVKYPLALSSAIWGVWHFPLILWGGYASSEIPILSAGLFFMMIMISGIFVGWLRMASGSVWVAMIYHASHNLFFQTAFEVFNKPGPRSSYLAGESGVIPCLVYFGVFTAGYFIFYRKHESKTL